MEGKIINKIESINDDIDNHKIININEVDNLIIKIKNLVKIHNDEIFRNKLKTAGYIFCK